MVAYERYITVENPDALVIPGLPLRKGQRVRVTVTLDESAPATDDAELRDLLQRTRELAPALTEEEIAAEIEAYRRERK
jgi:hypothetical protein